MIPPRTAVVIFALVLAAAQALCSAELVTAEQTRFPLAVTDDAGVRMTLAAPPGRIVSLTLPTDEILLSLVGSSRLAAVTTLSLDPAVSSVAAQAAAVPRRMMLTVEPIVALRADLVIAASWSDAGVVSQLRGAGVPVYLVASPTSVVGVEALIRRIALITGETGRGAAMVEDMEQKLRAVSHRVGQIPPGKRLRVLDYTTFGASMGKGSSWDDIVRRAGLVNAVDGLASDQWGQVPLSTEKLLRLDPDIIILPGWVYGDSRGARSFASGVKENAALQGLSAVKSGRVYTMPENLRVSTSQYIADAVQWLARTAYPGSFE
ncbi:MAG TPA: ABC transporter substrate-binding protein [Spirochaetia bacterium]|nr:ABC transporter substrate-binding protein [Spirochaetia bacterium]